MKLTLLSSNSKLKKDKIFNFTLPAYKSSTGLITCPNAAACIANCYARQGAYVFPVVKAKHERNLATSLTDDFISLMINDVVKSKAKIIRIHDAGDFYSREYAHKWLKIAESMPNVLFYAYTKSWDFFPSKLPENFRLVQSIGGKLKPDESKPHSKVFDSLETLLDAGYVNASESDLIAIYNDKVGLVFHSSKKETVNGFVHKKEVDTFNKAS